MLRPISSLTFISNKNPYCTFSTSCKKSTTIVKKPKPLKGSNRNLLIWVLNSWFIMEGTKLQGIIMTTIYWRFLSGSSGIFSDNKSLILLRFSSSSLCSYGTYWLTLKDARLQRHLLYHHLSHAPRVKLRHLRPTNQDPNRVQIHDTGPSLGVCIRF